MFPRGKLQAGGRTVVLDGPYGCTQDEGKAFIWAVVTQDATQATADGKFAAGSCTGGRASFRVEAKVRSGPAFKPGRALACGWADTQRSSKPFQEITSVHFWCEYVKL